MRSPNQILERITQGSSHKTILDDFSTVILAHTGMLKKNNASWSLGIFTATSGRTTTGRSGMPGVIDIWLQFFPTTQRFQSRPACSLPSRQAHEVVSFSTGSGF